MLACGVRLSVLGFAFAALSLPAATITWDGGANTGAWATANNWSPNTAPGSNDSLVFDASLANNQFSISLGAARTVQGVTFNSAAGVNAFTFSGSTLTLTNAGVVNNDAETQTFSSIVAVGTSNQTFNAATGGLLFNAVTLNRNLTLDGPGAIALGSSGGTLLVSGGNRTLTLSGTGSRTIGAVALSNNNTGRTLTIAGSGSATISGVISNGGNGAGNLIKTGNGTLTLSGANTYSGTTTIAQGKLLLNANAPSGAAGSLGNATSAVTLNTAATGTSNTALLLNTSGVTVGRAITVANQGTGTTTLGSNLTSGTGTFSGGITLGKATSFNADGTSSLTFSGVISGSGLLTKTGTGTVTLSGANTYSGGTALSSGTLAFGSNTAAGTGTLSIASGTTVQAAGAARTLANNLTIGGDFTIGGTQNLTFNGSINLGGGTRTLTVANTGTTTFAGVVTEPYYSGIVKAGSGTLVLQGANTYSAPTTVSAGTLVLANSSALGASGTWGHSIASGATLALQGGITVNQGGFSVDGTGDTGTGAFRNISGSNTLAGQLTFNGNTSIIADAGTLTLSGNPQIGANTVTVGGAGNVVMSGAANGAGGFTKTGAGTLTFSGSSANYFNNLLVDDGTVLLSKTAGTGAVGGNGAIVVGNSSGLASSAILRLGANEQIPDSATSFTINGDGLLDLNNFAETIDRLAGTGNVALGTSGALTVGAASNSSTFAGTISGSGTLTKAGSGTFTLTGTNTYTGATTILQGTLQLGAGGTTGSLAGSSIVNNGSLVFNRSNDFTYSGTISGSGTVVQNGPGAVTLSGNNSYTGSTTINLGTLKLGSAGSAGNGPLGTIAAGTVVNAGGALDLNGYTLANAEALSLQGSGVSSSGALTNSSATAVSYAGGVLLTNDVAMGGVGNITLTSGLSDNGTGRTLTKVGAGTLTLNAAATLWSGGNVVVNRGTFAVGATNALGTYATPNVVVNATTAGTTATFATNNSVSQTIQSLTFGGAGATSTSTNTVSLGSGSTLTLAGNVSYDATNNPLGATIAGAGTLALGSSSRTFDIANSSNAASDLTVSSNLSGSGSLVKTGAGTLALSGTNSGFTGGVTVNAGTLRASGSTVEGGFTALGNYSGLVSPTTVVSVASGATLAVQSSATSGYGTTAATLQTLALNGTGDGGVGALRALGGINTWSGNISLGSDTLITNAGAAGSADVLYLAPWLFQHTSLHLDLNHHDLTLSGTGNIAIASMIGSTSGDTGSVTLRGGDDTTRYTFAGLRNFYTGQTTLERGVLRLQVEPGGLDTGSGFIDTINTAVRGDLVIGTGSTTSTARVELRYSDQIADTVNVTINSDGTLDLGTWGKADTIGHLVLNGGTVSTVGTNQGILSLGGVTSGADIDVATAATSTISGLLHLNNIGGPARTINVAGGSTLNFSASLYGGSFIKDGAGTMILSSDNTTGYSGTTEIRNGILRIRDDYSLGQIANGTSEAAQTIVSNGATLELQPNSGSITFPNEYLVLSGAGYNSLGALHNVSGGNSWSGRVTLADSAAIKSDAGSTLTVFGSVVGTAGAATTQTLTVGGAGNTIITGGISNSGAGTLGIAKVDSGTLSLSGSNTFTGSLDVQAGTVALVANNTLGAQTNAVSVASGATLALSGSGNTNQIGELTGAGLVSLASGTTLRVNHAGADSFSGQLAGTGLFEKLGVGTFTFTSAANTGLFDFSGTVKLTDGTLEFQGGSLASSLSLGTLQLAGGTLFLNASTINVGTLNITADTILDFGTGAASVLNATNIYIAAGATLTVRNWSSEVDFLFANSSFHQNNGAGLGAIFNATGSAPQNQVHFEGDPLSADGSNTAWTNYYPGFEDHQIRPVPEPSFYGALLLGMSAGVFIYRRYRREHRRV
ncbi:autotransporter-associated beta strand repeat protein [Opitutus terrae PB90-1]|uniref:Autotransporter-associated beta strand repeat protein n=1 Tax=Opitutus terrae (strain DSM 11246 / JCM 15787 / PB90-1) TaxID=452637 RepID=B1ZW01_OPITP|nr:autotransporter-associated beta strand repeat protein [Opitutus terrae PB90-1]